MAFDEFAVDRDFFAGPHPQPVADPDEVQGDLFVEQGRGVKESFKASSRFFNARRSASFGLILWISFIGVLIWLVWAYGVAPVVKVARTAAGLPPFPKGLPNFLFNLVLVIPSAFLGVYFPLALGIFYRGRNGDTGTGA